MNEPESQMKLIVQMEMQVEAQTADEVEQAKRMREQIDAMDLRPPGRRRQAKMDESLMADFLSLMRDLGQLLNRADARRPGRGRGK